MPLLKPTQPLKCMPWGVVAAGVGAAGNIIASKNKNGGAGTSTDTKTPWANAIPFINRNIDTGQNLQNKLEAEPFSEMQKQAYANQYAQSDYMRGLVPGLLAQMQSQPVGFDRNNPQAKPTAWNWNAIGGLGGGGTGAAGSGSMTRAQQAQADIDAARALQEAEAKRQAGLFKDVSLADPSAAATSPGATDYEKQAFWASTMRTPWGGLDGGAAVNQQNLANLGIQNPFSGGYGEFKYGTMPASGTQAYRDMNEYFLRGGADAANIYGKGGPSAYDGGSGPAFGPVNQT